MSIKENLSALFQKIEAVTQQSGRKREEISFIAVSKGRSPDDIKEAYTAGCRDFGENRIPEALEKMELCPQDIRWHFLGHLQRNKVSKIIGRFVLIHSIDTPELAEKVSEMSLQKGVRTSILLEANTSQESTKSGFSPAEWDKVFLQLLDLQGIEILGLMTMAPLTEDKGLIRHTFSELRSLRDHLQQRAHTRADLSILSMGMSHDYEIAIQEGATLLRIGSALFNP